MFFFTFAVSGYSENASPIDFSVSSQQQQQHQQQVQSSHFLQRDVKMESASSDLQRQQHQHQHQLLLGSDPSKLPQLLNPVDLDQSISKYLAANGTDGEPPSVDQASKNE